MTVTRFGTSSIVGPQGPAGAYDPSMVTNAQVGTSYTLVSSDAGKLVSLTNAGAITVLVPVNASQPIPIGTQINIYQGGTGQVTVTPDAGVTINNRAGLKIVGQHGIATLIKTDTNVWLMAGATVV